MGPTMKLCISYDPESDTLDIGNGLPGSDGQPVADRLTAFFGDADGDDVVGVTLENAVEVLAPYLQQYLVKSEKRVPATVLRDDGEPS